MRTLKKEKLASLKELAEYNRNMMLNYEKMVDKYRMKWHNVLDIIEEIEEEIDFELLCEDTRRQMEGLNKENNV